MALKAVQGKAPEHIILMIQSDEMVNIVRIPRTILPKSPPKVGDQLLDYWQKWTIIKVYSPEEERKLSAIYELVGEDMFKTLFIAHTRKPPD